MKWIKLDVSFLAMVCVLGWLDGWLCLWVLLGIICHESGHYLMLKLYRVRVYSVKFTIGGAMIKTEVMRYRTEIICALAGPLSGLLASAICIRWLPGFALISACLSLANLLPLYPLDGGRVLAAFLSKCEKGERILHRVTVVTCCTMMLLSCWLTVRMQAGLWPVFLALLVLCRAGTREKQLLFRP